MADQNWRILEFGSSTRKKGFFTYFSSRKGNVLDVPNKNIRLRILLNTYFTLIPPFNLTMSFCHSK